jgi:lipopolysaccharide transport system permease protein
MSPKDAITSTMRPRRPRKVIKPARSFLSSVPDNLKSLLQYGSLFRAMTATRLKIRYRQSILGWLWAVVQPLALMVLFSAVFSHAVGYGKTLTPYPLFVLTGLLPWSFCSTAISTSAGGMLSHHALMTKVYFPREIVTFSYVAVALFDLLIGLVMLLIMISLYGVATTPLLLYAIPIIALLVLHTAGACLLLSAVQVRIRDINVALPLLLQILMFTAPVVYPDTVIPENLRPLYWANPLAVLVSDFRRSMLGLGPPEGSHMLYCSLSGCLAFLLGYAVFKRLETSIVDEM